ncbi:hypothetical protein D9M71_785270 [compost metagenome]
MRVEAQAIIALQPLAGGRGFDGGAHGDPGLPAGGVAQAEVAEVSFLAQRRDAAPIQPVFVDRLIVIDGPVSEAFIEHQAPPGNDIQGREYT